VRSNNFTNGNVNNTNGRERTGGGGGAEGSSSLLLRPSFDTIGQQATTSSDFGLQWGNRKRLRCMKVQVKDKDKDKYIDLTGPVHKTTVRVDRRVVRADKDSSSQHANHSNGYLNLRQRPSSSPPPPPQRILRYVIFFYIYIYIYLNIKMFSFCCGCGACGSRYAEWRKFDCLVGYFVGWGGWWSD
jgi:hypothetical protein